MLLIASAIISLVFYYSTASHETFYTYYPHPERATNWAQMEEYKNELKEEQDSRIYTIPLLGVSVRVEDLSVVGPAALLILYYYYAASSRLSLSLISSLLKKQTLNATSREFAMASLSSGLLLNTPDVYLARDPQSSHVTRAGWAASTWLYRVLIFYPFGVSCACLFTDLIVVKTNWRHELPFRLLGVAMTGVILLFAVTVTRNNTRIREIYSTLDA